MSLWCAAMICLTVRTSAARRTHDSAPIAGSEWQAGPMVAKILARRPTLVTLVDDGGVGLESGLSRSAFNSSPSTDHQVSHRECSNRDAQIAGSVTRADMKTDRALVRGSGATHRGQLFSQHG